MRSRKPSIDLSIVIPLYNEEEGIPALINELNRLVSQLKMSTEILFVNDGSSDSTEEQLSQAKLHAQSMIITFTRNFGHQAALLAGMEQAKGKYVVTMDGDLQHPVDVIATMVSLHKKGIDIVLTKRIDRQSTDLIKRSTSSFFYKVLNSIAHHKITESSSDFRSVNRRALNQLLSLPEKRKFLRGMVEWIGYSQYVIPYKVHKRVSGSSKYSFRKMINLAIIGITSYSTAPLYVSVLVGAILFFFAACYAIYVIVVRMVFQQAVQGWASVLFVILVIGGFICLFLGILGLYIAAIYDEVKSRPNYIINKVIKQ